MTTMDEMVRTLFCVCAIVFMIKDNEACTGTTLVPNSSSTIENGTYTMKCFTMLIETLSIWIRNSDDSDTAAIILEVDGSCTSTKFFKDKPRLFDYSCNHNETCNIFSLTLKNVSRYQNGEKWRCRDISYRYSDEIAVQVLVPVQSLSFDTTVPHTLTLLENVGTNVSCRTSFSRPAATITWYIAGGTELSKKELPELDSSVNTSNIGLVSKLSTLRLTLNRTYNRWNLTCEAGNNVQGYNAVAKSVMLNVAYPTDHPTIQCINNGIYKVVQNTKGNLTCSVDGGNPAGTLHWNCTGGVSEKQGPNSNRTQTLVWNATQTQYCTCTATNIAGSRSTSVKTELLCPPVIAELVDKVVFKGDSVTLQCVVVEANTSKSVIGWTSARHSYTSGSTLTIYNVTRTDNGTYTCMANNTMEPSCRDVVLGNASKSLHINVLYPPTVNIPSGKKFTVKEGDRFSYTCPVEPGNPPSTNITWRRSTDTKPWHSSELLIHNITRFDEAIYTCYASNVMTNSSNVSRISNVSADIRLTVQFKTNVTDFYIQNHRHKSNVTVIENISLDFECHLQSNPTSDVRLYQGDTLVNSARANELLYHTTATCSGRPTKYSCQGNNSISNTASIREIQLFVNCTPKRDMEIEELVAAGAINETVTLSYTALAYPLPSFTWYRNDSSINTTESDPRFIVSSADFKTNLTITQVLESDFGEYTLTVANDLGFINESFRLKPQGVPEVPTHLTQDDTSTTDSKIALYWTSGFNNGLEQTFTIMHRKQTEYTWMDDSVPNKGHTGTTQHYNITGLSSDTNYDVVLFSVNAIGPSKSNATLICITKEAVTMNNSDSPAALIGAIVGVVVGVILAAVVIIVGVVMFKRRKQRKSSGHATENPETTAKIYQNVKNSKTPLIKQDLSPLVATSDPGVYENADLGKSSKHRMPPSGKGENVNITKKRGNEKQTTNHEELPMHVTLPNITASRHRSPESDAPPPVPAKVDFAGLLKVDDDDGHVNNNTVDENVYNNSSFKLERIEDVFVHELFDFVAEKSMDAFGAEFNILPKGLTMPYSVAVKPENIKLNRYNGIFPYDHSRVTFPEDPDFFVNACYMDGYKREKCYIAALGPTTDSSKGFKTFWRMVWHEQIDVIVMVTNLRELTGMKCERYWPLMDSSIVYGEITVTSKKVEEYAEYTVRTFNVSHDNNCRSVTQLHFTAWPDKGVPDDLTSLLEFRQRIYSTPSIKLGPVIVHCSAGIGRTGTYIALDRLIVEGKASNSINVSTCVRNMRQQRVSMVQTQEQYMYIYKACVYALAFECVSILAESFHDKFKATTDGQLFSDLFKKLKMVVDNEKKDEKEAILTNKLERSNRANADIEGDRHRVRLYVDKESEDSDYTNAIYINSFKTKNKFIAAQTPLRDFVQDLVCTVFQEQCICVIDMDGSLPSKMDVGANIQTAKDSVTFGNFTITCDKLESNPKYTVTKMKIENTGKFYKGDWTSYHFKYHDWKHGKDIPGNAKDFVDLWNEVNEYANQFGDKNSHILIHCLDGSTRSGLFCFVACLLEKVQCERQVNVGNTLRQVRTRRKTTVKTVNQLKFCFKTVDAFIETTKAL